MRTRRSLVALAFAAALVLLAAPGGATVPGAKSACRYLKLSEVDDITGLTFVKGATPPAPSVVAACGYAGADDPATAVNLWVQRGSSSVAGFRAAKEAFAADGESVSGLGKKAFYAGEGVNTVYVLKGKTLVYVQYVSIGNANPDGVRDATVEMTRVVLDRT